MDDAGVAGPDWDGLEHELVRLAAGLADGEQVTLRVERADVPPLVVKPRRMFGLVPPKQVRTLPEVELTRVEQHLRVECTGDARRGGPIPLPEEALATVARLGWHPGGGPDGSRWTRFWPDDVAVGPYPPHGGPEGAGRLAVATLREVFGVPSPAVVQVAQRP